MPAIFMVDLKKLGKECQDFRRGIHRTQVYVAMELNYSVEAISGFENGRNNNLIILSWYIKNGLPIEKIINSVGVREYDD